MLDGTEGSQTFKGIIGHTRIYRLLLFFANQVKENNVHLNLLTLMFYDLKSWDFSCSSCLNFSVTALPTQAAIWGICK